MQIGKRARGKRKVGAGKLRRGEHGKRVLHKMAPRGAEAIAHRLAHDVGADLRTIGTELETDGARVGFFGLTEAYDFRAAVTGALRESLIMRVVAIEDCRAARLEPIEDLGLGVGNLLDRAEEAEMHRRDGGDDGDSG